jgi:hypothetical protein
MKQFNLIVLLLTIAMFGACSKKHNSSNTNPGTEDPGSGIVLTDNEKYVLGSWKLVRIVDSNYTGTTLNDVQDGVPYPCTADNILTFKDDRKYTVDEGADTCLSGSKEGEYEWSIDGDHFNYKHGPGLMYADGTLRRIDDDNFAVYAHNYWWNNSNTMKTFYYKRK